MRSHRGPIAVGGRIIETGTDSFRLAHTRQKGSPNPPPSPETEHHRPLRRRTTEIRPVATPGFRHACEDHVWLSRDAAVLMQVLQLGH